MLILLSFDLKDPGDGDYDTAWKLLSTKYGFNKMVKYGGKEMQLPSTTAMVNFKDALKLTALRDGIKQLFDANDLTIKRIVVADVNDWDV